MVNETAIFESVWDAADEIMKSMDTQPYQSYDVRRVHFEWGDIEYNFEGDGNNIFDTVYSLLMNEDGTCNIIASAMTTDDIEVEMVYYNYGEDVNSIYTRFIMRNLERVYMIREYNE